MNTLPRPSDWHAHALAISRAASYVQEHWESFWKMLPESTEDGVVESRIFRQFSELVDALNTYANQFNSPGICDHDHATAIREAQNYIEYVPVEHLGIIAELFDEATHRMEAVA